MDTSDAGRKGGQSRSAAKRAASAKNLAKARFTRRTKSCGDCHTRILTGTQTLNILGKLRGAGSTATFDELFEAVPEPNPAPGPVLIQRSK